MQNCLIFETVKTTITLRQAAEHFSLTMSRNGMTCCPFHDDRHPSLKLNDETFYCFGCGETGDVIDFTAKLCGITNLEAAQKLAAAAAAPCPWRASSRFCP